jgi:hypothetical protein
MQAETGLPWMTKVFYSRVLFRLVIMSRCWARDLGKPVRPPVCLSRATCQRFRGAQEKRRG